LLPRSNPPQKKSPKKHGNVYIHGDQLLHHWKKKKKTIKMPLFFFLSKRIFSSGKKKELSKKEKTPRDIISTARPYILVSHGTGRKERAIDLSGGENERDEQL